MVPMEIMVPMEVPMVETVRILLWIWFLFSFGTACESDKAFAMQ